MFDITNHGGVFKGNKNVKANGFEAEYLAFEDINEGDFVSIESLAESPTYTVNNIVDVPESDFFKFGELDSNKTFKINDNLILNIYTTMTTGGLYACAIDVSENLDIKFLNKTMVSNEVKLILGVIKASKNAVIIVYIMDYLSSNTRGLKAVRVEIDENTKNITSKQMDISGNGTNKFYHTSNYHQDFLLFPTSETDGLFVFSMSKDTPFSSSGDSRLFVTSYTNTIGFKEFIINESKIVQLNYTSTGYRPNIHALFLAGNTFNLLGDGYSYKFSYSKENGITNVSKATFPTRISTTSKTNIIYKNIKKDNAVLSHDGAITYLITFKESFVVTRIGSSLRSQFEMFNVWKPYEKEVKEENTLNESNYFMMLDEGSIITFRTSTYTGGSYIDALKMTRVNISPNFASMTDAVDVTGKYINIGSSSGTPISIFNKDRTRMKFIFNDYKFHGTNTRLPRIMDVTFVYGKKATVSKYKFLKEFHGIAKNNAKKNGIVKVIRP